MYTSKAACERAYTAYRAKKHGPRRSAPVGSFVVKRAKKFGVKL